MQSAVARNYDTVAIPMMGTGATDMAQTRVKGQQCFGIGPAADLDPHAVGELGDRQVHAEAHRWVDVAHRGTGRAQHDVAEQQVETGILGQIEERRRREQPALGVVPPHQRQCQRQRHLFHKKNRL